MHNYLHHISSLAISTPNFLENDHDTVCCASYLHACFWLCKCRQWQNTADCRDTL